MATLRPNRINCRIAKNEALIKCSPLSASVKSLVADGWKFIIWSPSSDRNGTGSHSSLLIRNSCGCSCSVAIEFMNCNKFKNLTASYSDSIAINQRSMAAKRVVVDSDNEAPFVKSIVIYFPRVHKFPETVKLQCFWSKNTRNFCCFRNVLRTLRNY